MSETFLSVVVGFIASPNSNLKFYSPHAMKLSESGLIRALQVEFPSHIGDDAAVIPTGSDPYVITKDLLIEDVHFRTRYMSPADLAHKALHVNLSDCAAMGAEPKFILCGIGIPLHQAAYAQALLMALTKACKAAEVLLIGGDTCLSTDKLLISITAIGSCPQSNLKYRRHAKAGDLIVVAGDLGHAHLGFKALEIGKPGMKSYKQAFLRPTAKVKEAHYLAQSPCVNAMMDLSDGLFIDLERMSQASQLAGCIQLEQLTQSASFMRACKVLSLDPLTSTLTGGEDYSLLLTVTPEEYPCLAAGFLADFGYILKQIGYMQEGSGVYGVEGGEINALHCRPFSHFD